MSVSVDSGLEVLDDSEEDKSRKGKKAKRRPTRPRSPTHVSTNNLNLENPFRK